MSYFNAVITAYIKLWFLNDFYFYLWYNLIDVWYFHFFSNDWSMKLSLNIIEKNLEISNVNIEISLFKMLYHILKLFKIFLFRFVIQRVCVSGTLWGRGRRWRSTTRSHLGARGARSRSTPRWFSTRTCLHTTRRHRFFLSQSKGNYNHLNYTN